MIRWMIRVETYRPSKHEKHLKEWVKARNLSENFLKVLPKHGAVAFCKDHAVAAVFLRRIEKCEYVMMDSLITNPLETAEIRNEAINQLVSNVIHVAEKLKMKSIMAYSTDENTLFRSTQFGFEARPEKVIALRFKEEKI